MFADGRFFTPSGWARFIAIEDPVLAEPPDADFPFLLNTGRVRDQWHTMTRSLSPKLASHMPDPFVEVNPDDASKLGLAEDGFARVSTAHGTVVLRVNITAAQVPGRIFVPIHWNDEMAGRARMGALVHPFTDPHSGQPDSKAVPAALAPVCFRRARLCSCARTRAAAGRHRLCMDQRLCGKICDERAFRSFVRGLCRQITRGRAGELQ
jgi:assimilatory nitrate reductase catalytic subunit